MRKNEFLDNKPPEKIEKYAWNMRPRSKEREIGPEIKHNHKLQIERIYDQLNKRKSPIFQDINLTDHQLHHQARAFVKSGSIKRHQSFNAHSGNIIQIFLKSKKNRLFVLNLYDERIKARIQQFLRQSNATNVTITQQISFQGCHFTINRQGILYEPKTKPDERSLPVYSFKSKHAKQNSLGESFGLFQDKTISSRGKSAGMSTRKENTFFNNNFSDAIPSLNNTRVNYISDKKELNLRLSPTKIATGRPQTIQNQRQKQDQLSVKSKLNTQNTDKNSFLRRSNNDQDIPLVPFFAEDVDHREVSHDILKLCNIIRDKHHKTSILRKSSGLGGGANPNKYTQLQDAMISTKSMIKL